MALGRNDPCPCGSGKKYKRCCLPKTRAALGSRRPGGPFAGGPPDGLPLLVDAGSGEPVSLVTDHWVVRDWKALTAALESQPDVEGDREKGWARLEDGDDDFRRSLLAINPGRGNRLETFARTLRRADEGREWLTRVAGDAVEHKIREIADPWSAAGAGALLSTAKGSGGRGAGLPMDREMMQDLLRRMYRHWADEPIPALGGRTPRQAVESPDGRAKVIGLLRLYEDGELEQAQEQGREPASFGFLWNAVGLDREKALAMAPFPTDWTAKP